MIHQPVNTPEQACKEAQRRSDVLRTPHWVLEVESGWVVLPQEPKGGNGERFDPQPPTLTISRDEMAAWFEQWVIGYKFCIKHKDGNRFFTPQDVAKQLRDPRSKHDLPL